MHTIWSNTFLSKCWGGGASDILIVWESGFCSSELHIPGDQVFADWAFTLKDDFAAGSGSELIIPAFTKNKSQLSANEVETSRNISLVQIYIECVIGLFKNRYTILKGIMHIMTVKSIKDESLQTVLAT